MAFDSDKLIDGVGPAIGLTIDPAHRDGVARFLRIAETMARTVDAVPLPATSLDLAAVFTPIAPHD